MIFSLFLVCSSFVSISSARGLSWTPALQTATANDRAPAQGGWSPKPTAAPNKANEVLELFKRQTYAINTCGFFNGISSEPFTCAGAGYCAHNSYSAVGCCTGDIDLCDIFTTCVDYSSVSAVCALADELTGCCNDAAYPYCATYLWNDPQRSMIRCVKSPAFYLMSDYPVTDADSTTATPVVTISRSTASAASSIQNGDDAADVTTASGSGSGNVVSSAGAHSSASASSPTPFASTTTQKKSSVPLGAIIGGAVGGVAVIALLIVAIIFLVRKNKSHPSPPQPQPQTSAILPKHPYQGPPPNSPPPFYENRASIAKPIYNPPQNTSELASTVYIPPAIPEYYQPPKQDAQDAPVSPNTDTGTYMTSNHQFYSDPGCQYSELDATALNSVNGHWNGQGVEIDGVATRPTHGTEIGPSR